MKGFILNNLLNLDSGLTERVTDTCNLLKILHKLSNTFKLSDLILLHKLAAYFLVYLAADIYWKVNDVERVNKLEIIFQC